MLYLGAVEEWMALEELQRARGVVNGSRRNVEGSRRNVEELYKALDKL